MTEVARQHPLVVVKYFKGLLYLKSLQEQEKYQPKKVGLFWGLTGTGKTLTAHQELDDLYTVVDIKTPWFDGYFGQENVLMDECGNGMMHYNRLKQILDGYRLDVPVKGGMVPWVPKTIILTSNCPLEDWFPQLPREDLWALQRRIRIFRFPEEKQLATAWLRGSLIESESVKLAPPHPSELTQQDTLQDLIRQPVDLYDLVNFD